MPPPFVVRRSIFHLLGSVILSLKTDRYTAYYTAPFVVPVQAWSTLTVSMQVYAR